MLSNDDFFLLYLFTHCFVRSLSPYFGSLIHRTGVLRSRADEDASPTTQRRPRQPEADMLWVEDQGTYQRDPDLYRG